MEHGGHSKSAFLDELTVFLSDFIIGLDQSHSGDSAEAYDDLGLDQLYLLAEITDAGILLCRQGITIFGRTTLEDVCDIHVLALDIDGVEEAVEKLTRSADKGSSRKILLLARCFADEHQIGVSVARSENAIRSRLAELARSAMLTFL